MMASTADAVSGTGAALDARHLSKGFGGRPALDDFSLTVQPGEIHALAGENGSGKSTFIKILSGYHRPDPGAEITVRGDLLVLGSPQSSQQLGFRFVHQDLGLVANRSIADNLALTAGYPTRFATIRRRDFHRTVQADIARVGLSVDVRTPIEALSPAMRTGVALARALRPEKDAHHPAARVLVLDEPTATLPDDQVRQLLDMVVAVAQSGVGVVYVTHRLDEIFAIADNVSVLRDGRCVAQRAVSSLSRRELTTLLVGHDVAAGNGSERGGAVLAPADATGNGTGPAQAAGKHLRVENLTAETLRRIDLTADGGEILGIAGITGSGREQILGVIYGALKRDEGTVTVGGDIVPPERPSRSMKLGLAYVPPDRKAQGAILTLTARENMSVVDLARFWRHLHLRRKYEMEVTREWFERLGIRPAAGLNNRFDTFSGGNQQKIVMAKGLRANPRVFLVDEPTQGVDVGAREDLHNELRDAASRGTTVVVASSDTRELADLCDRVLILRNGRIAAELAGGEINAAAISHFVLDSSNSSEVTSA